MAEETIDRLLRAFIEASGGQTPGGRTSSPGESAAESPDASSDSAGSYGSASPLAGSSGAGSSTSSGDPMGQAASAAAGLYGSSANPVGGDVYGGPSSSQSSGGGGSTVGSIATTIFESGFGMAALAEGLIGLFSGGSSAPAPLEKYEMPSAIDFSSAETSSGLSGADYDQSDAPRTVGQGSGGSSSGAGSSGQAGQQITVNVQTMDAQSFMDNSSAIAQAVRGAMLNSSSINDVVNEL